MRDHDDEPGDFRCPAASPPPGCRWACRSSAVIATNGASCSPPTRSSRPRATENGGRRTCHDTRHRQQPRRWPAGAEKRAADNRAGPAFASTTAPGDWDRSSWTGRRTPVATVTTAAAAVEAGGTWRQEGVEAAGVRISPSRTISRRSRSTSAAARAWSSARRGGSNRETC